MIKSQIINLIPNLFLATSSNSQFQLENVSPLLVFMLQRNSNVILKTQFGQNLLHALLSQKFNISKSIPTPKTKKPLESVGTHSPTLGQVCLNPKTLSPTLGSCLALVKARS